MIIITIRLLLNVILSRPSSADSCPVKSSGRGSASGGAATYRRFGNIFQVTSGRKLQLRLVYQSKQRSTQQQLSPARPALLRSGGRPTGCCPCSLSQLHDLHEQEHLTHTHMHRNTHQCLRRGINTIHHIPTRLASFPSHLT